MRTVKMREILRFEDCEPVWGERAVRCLQDGDLPDPLLLAAVREKWARDLAASGGDRGTCVLGAGLAVWYLAPRKRRPVLRVLVSPPGQADCAWCAEGATRLLRTFLPEGAEVEFEYGRMD
jgi:hypothetical protein